MSGIRFVSAFAFACLAGAAHAEICYSTDAVPTNSSVFTCPQAGARTIVQLAQQGFVVRQLSPRQSGGGTTWQLLLQRSELIFRNSFEN